MDRPFQRVPDCQLQLREEQFRAIGHMVVQWAFLESTINQEIRCLLGREENAGKHVNFQARFSIRTAHWQELAKASYSGHRPIIKTVARIASDANKIKTERDDYAHGSMSGSGTFYKIKEGVVIDIDDEKGTPAYIEDLACRISTINGAMLKHHLILRRTLGIQP